MCYNLTTVPHNVLLHNCFNNQVEDKMPFFSSALDTVICWHKQKYWWYKRLLKSAGTFIKRKPPMSVLCRIKRNWSGNNPVTVRPTRRVCWRKYECDVSFPPYLKVILIRWQKHIFYPSYPSSCLLITWCELTQPKYNQLWGFVCFVFSFFFFSWRVDKCSKLSVQSVCSHFHG